MTIAGSGRYLDPEISESVADALSEGRPVVALESTVVSHGLPFPDNIETARGMLEAVRLSGAEPALVAVLGGRFRIGLGGQELERLTSPKIRKVSVRDLAIAAAEKLDGATTVATTSLAARAAGIRVFATGGIGGIHRGFSADISADLPVLARTPITVVCSGAKSVLDLPATREWLETNGVPVLGLGCRELPGFYCRTSGLPVDHEVQSEEQAAEIVIARDRLGLTQAVLVTVPVPSGSEVDPDSIEEWIRFGLTEAEAQGITGKEVTPFLLSKMAELSGGKTLQANKALLLNNASVAGRLASYLSRGES